MTCQGCGCDVTDKHSLIDGLCDDCQKIKAESGFEMPPLRRMIMPGEVD